VANSLHIGVDFFAALDEYAKAANAAVQESAEATMFNVQEGMKAAARKNERWMPVAEHIETWSQDGRFVVGIRNADVMSEAVAAEYGDAENPPVPLIRSVDAMYGGSAMRSFT
jgi:hypothetical protein